MVQFSGFASLVLCIQTRILSKLSGFPHSDITGSLLYCQLSDAFRRLTRPSSPIIAKASTWCTYSLDSIIWRTFWLRYSQRWLLPTTWILYFDKAYCFVVSQSCLLCFRIKSIQSSPKYCVCFLFSRERFLPFAKGKNQNRLQRSAAYFDLRSK